MRQMLVVLVCLLVIAALEGLYHLVRYFTERRAAELKRRLGQLGEVAGVETGLLRRERYAKSPALDALVRALPGAPALERLLAQADLPMTVAQLLVWSSACGFLGAALPLAVRAGAPAAIALGLLAAAGPSAAALLARSRRSARLSEQLPEALDMMCRSMRAGHALPAAFRLVASEMPGPVNVEFGRAYEEQRLGLDVEQAVVNMTARSPLNRDLKIFAVSVVVQKETGGNLAEILENIASTIRERYRFAAKLRALTAEGRTSGLVLGALPLAMGMFLAVANPKYLGRLFDNNMGRLVLAYAVVSWLLGGLWMQRMGKVDY